MAAQEQRKRSTSRTGWRAPERTFRKEVLIESEVDAAMRGFRGSPTVLVDGDDVESESELPIGAMG